SKLFNTLNYLSGRGHPDLRREQMSNTETLKQYLLEKENAYLLDDNNNGKTIMLSGAWGSGKTHFWKEEIEREQKKIKVLGKKEKEDKYTSEQYKEGLHSKLKDKEKACVYVSLYGKTSIESLELDVYMKAYQNIVGDADAVSTMCSVFTNLGKNLGNMAHKGVGGTFAWMENLVDKDKFDKAGTYLEDGGIICFDDFERKSKEIDLNDLFGFISQLALEYRCKVVIVLNSDAFTGKEAEVFSNVKEKTISKFFYFNPSIEELFKSISDNSKYDELNDYKENILSVIKETEEVNARIYTQVLDNCLEWLDVKKVLDSKIIRVLVLATFNFVLNRMILDYKKVDCENSDCKIAYDIIETYPEIVLIRSMAGCHFLDRFQVKDIKSYINYCGTLKDTQLIDTMRSNVTQSDFKASTSDLSIEIPKFKYPELLQKEAFDWINSNEQELKALWKYGYRLYYVGHVDEVTYNEVAQFIESGILI
ncbi:MAG: hypothetical protein KAI79_13725, partial [Bacteroidales bacterium]|nr:hypothetical protein [Bacteroidales bacterium]